MHKQIFYALHVHQDTVILPLVQHLLLHALHVPQVNIQIQMMELDVILVPLVNILQLQLLGHALYAQMDTVILLLVQHLLLHALHVYQVNIQIQFQLYVPIVPLVNILQLQLLLYAQHVHLDTVLRLVHYHHLHALHVQLVHIL